MFEQPRAAKLEFANSSDRSWLLKRVPVSSSLLILVREARRFPHPFNILAQSASKFCTFSCINACLFYYTSHNIWQPNHQLPAGKRLGPKVILCQICQSGPKWSNCELCTVRNQNFVNTRMHIEILKYLPWSKVGLGLTHMLVHYHTTSTVGIQLQLTT